MAQPLPIVEAGGGWGSLSALQSFSGPHRGQDFVDNFGFQALRQSIDQAAQRFRPRISIVDLAGSRQRLGEHGRFFFIRHKVDQIL